MPTNINAPFLKEITINTLKFILKGFIDFIVDPSLHVMSDCVDALMSSLQRAVVGAAPTTGGVAAAGGEGNESTFGDRETYGGADSGDGGRPPVDGSTANVGGRDRSQSASASHVAPVTTPKSPHHTG